MKQYVFSPIHDWLSSNGYYGATIGILTSIWTGSLDLITDDKLLKCISLLAGILGLVAAYYTARIKHKEYKKLKANE